MADKLLIRAFNVRCGDCIYVRIPKARKQGGQIDDFHILIDCGSKADYEVLKSALDLLKPDLPVDANGMHRLDLVVVSHEHEDHMKGFNPAWFQDVAIENIWLSVAMDRSHPQSQLAHAFHGLAEQAMQNVAARGVALGPALQELVAIYGIGNKGAVKALTDTLPTQNGITPLYVHSKTKAAALKPKTLTGDVKFKVLGPDENIDLYYMGDEDAVLQTFSEAAAGVLGSARAPAGVQPTNINGLDFRRLQSRMMSNAFAFASDDSALINNTSVMLLIEWRGRRLLFVGDAEWDLEYEEGKHNGAWNVAWKKQRAKLDAPLDFLKIGHHGSTNATPWNDKEDGTVTEPSTILDAILPLPAGPIPKSGPKAVASTARTPYKVIPRSNLLVEIGKRVGNVQTYAPLLSAAQIHDLPNYSSHEKALLGEPQPQRTDMESLVTGLPYVDIEITPAAGH